MPNNQADTYSFNFLNTLSFSTMRFTVIVMLMAFSFISSDVLAQDAIKSTTEKKESVHPKTDNSQPYYMYKDIKDINEAKKAWVSDNPNKYKEMLKENSPKETNSMKPYGSELNSTMKREDNPKK